MSKQDADEHARREYDDFAERRRRFLEAEGARDEIKRLEDFSSNDSD